MKKVFCIVLAIAWSIGVFCQPWSGPFGLKMGLTQKQLEASGITLTEIGDNVFMASKVPNPHRDFSNYMLIVSPTSGLAKILAISDDITTDSQGYKLRNEYEDIKSLLDSKYGESDETDFLMYGSIWSDADDFMMALKLEERYLECSWVDTGDVMKSNEISTIALEAEARDNYTGYLSLLYEFDNFSDYVDSVKEKDKDAF